MAELVPNKNYSDILPIKYNLEDPDRLLDLSVPNAFITQQGIQLLEYDFLLSANDVKTKNFTTNYLTSPKTEDEIFDLVIPEALDGSTSTTIQWTMPQRSGQVSNLTIDKNQSSLSSLAFFSTLSTTQETLTAQTFNISFTSKPFGEVCQIYTFDEGYKKYLVQRNNFELKYPQIVFDTLSSASDTARTIFNVVRDPVNNRLRLFFNNYTSTVGHQNNINPERSSTGIITGGGTRFIVPNLANRDTVSNPMGFKLVEPLTARQNLATTEILSSNVTYNDLIRETSYFNKSNNFVYYTTSGVNIDQAKSLSGLEYNYIIYNPYESNTINTSTKQIEAKVNYFNLKNQIAESGSVNKNLTLEGNKQQQRIYNSILNDETSETSAEGLQLGYNSYTANYKFKPDSITKFKLPDTLGPYVKINLNDAGLQEAGAFAALSPYFSDKIYKDVNPNENPKLENTLLQNGTFNENNGNLLVSWLYDDGKEGKWFDRYFVPSLSSTSVFSAITGNLNYVEGVDRLADLRNITLALGLTSMNYIDIDSTMVLEPSATYFYQRIGKDKANDMIDLQADKQVKRNFNPIDATTGSVGVSSNALVFDGTVYEKFSIPQDQTTGINLTFKIDTPSISEFKAYQIIGNLYNTGVGIIKNFYYTPFVYFAEGDTVFLFDTDMNLKKQIKLQNVREIKDLPYLTQAGDFTAVVDSDASDDDRLVRVSFNGDIEVVNTGVGLNPLFLEGGAAAPMRSMYNVGPKAIFRAASFTPGGGVGGDAIDVDLLTLEQLSLVNGQDAVDARGRYGEISVFRRKNDTKFGSMSGQRAVNIDDTIAASISGDNCILFKDFSKFETNLTDGTGTPVTPFLGKTFVAFYSPEKIWDINAFDGKLYVQTGASGTSPKLKILSTERELLSTINLSTSAVSGCKIDFVSEDYEIKPIAISRSSDYKLIVDKITTESAGSSGHFVESYSMGISSTNSGYHIGASEPSTFQSRTDLRFGFKMNPTALHFVNNTFKHVENKLNVITRYDNEFVKVSVNRKWEDWDKNWDNVNSGLWTFNYAAGENSLTDESKITTLSGIEGAGGCVSINLDLIVGEATIFIDGEVSSRYTIKSGQKPLKNYLNNSFFVGVPNLNEQPVTEIITNQILTAKNGTLKNLYAYNISLRSDLIRYHCLAEGNVNDIIFDITTGVRNNIETIDKLFTYKIPGNVSSRAVIRISDGNLNEQDANILANELTGRLGPYLPISINSVEFDFSIGNIFQDSIVKNITI